MAPPGLRAAFVAGLRASPIGMLSFWCCSVLLSVILSRLFSPSGGPASRAQRAPVLQHVVVVGLRSGNSDTGDGYRSGKNIEVSRVLQHIVR